MQILDSGAGFSGVGLQRKMTDISKASNVTIQGAFGEAIFPPLDYMGCTVFRTCRLNRLLPLYTRSRVSQNTIE